MEEGIVHVEDLARATGIWLVNSLRDWIDVELVAGRVDLRHPAST